ncbi:MAG: hypothetical protein CVU39_26640 [Chloroflexi bacterium HGW-Chloroflexi-10]|nr:MAG: hypothetical protein CVU39_26640 [Chloroflexi bacterium HGW-Chloroflexi-10]
MSIRLKKLATKDLGPLRDITIDFSDVNLIYGKNESGKTFLVEFLISSLFKNPTFPGMRKVPQNGFVSLSGMNSNKDTEFKPIKNAKKIEDLLMKDHERLPHDISKLLVVRGGELNFEESKEGISEKVLKEYLSNEATLDSIRNGISKTIQKLEFSNGQIFGKSTGENKTRTQIEDSLNAVEQLIAEADNLFSDGPMRVIQNKLDSHRKKLESLENDRRKFAFQTYSIKKKYEKTITEKQSQVEAIYAAIIRKCELFEEEKQKLIEKKNETSINVLQEINLLDSRLLTEKQKIGEMVFAIQKMIDHLEQRTMLFDLNQMDQIASKVRTYRENKAKAEELQKQMEPFSDKNEKLVWLQQAIEEYQNCIGSEKEPRQEKGWKNWPLTILALVIFGLVSIVLLVSSQPIMLKLAGIFSGLAISLLMVVNTINANHSIKNISAKVQHANTESEIMAIRRHFADLFGIHAEVVDLPTIKNQRDQLKEAEISFQSLKKGLDALAAQSQTLEHEILETMFAWENEHILEKHWEDILEKHRMEADNLSKELVYVKTYLEGLNLTEIPIVKSPIYFDRAIIDLQTMIKAAEENRRVYSRELDLREAYLERFDPGAKQGSNQSANELKPMSQWEDLLKQLLESEQKMSKEITILKAYFAEQDVEMLKAHPRNQQIEEQEFETLRKFVNEIKGTIASIEKEVNQLELQLSGLRVSRDAYIAADPNEIVAFDEKDYQDTEVKIQQLECQLEEEKGNLQNLKMKIMGYLSAENVHWEALLLGLNQKKKSLQKELSDLEAKIIAGICVNQVLDQLANDERDQLRRSLNTPRVVSPLKKITGHYQEYLLENERLFVRDEYDTFPISEVSTGTREQIFLSLRLGFAMNLLENDHLFLILDDAFQHSDWQRRDNLIDQMFKLATDGWQITYFTMDDHIRDLFTKTAKNYSVNYNLITLEK